MHTPPPALFIQEGISLRCLTALPKRKTVIFFHGQRNKAARDMYICVLVCVCVCLCVYMCMCVFEIGEPSQPKSVFPKSDKM